MISLCSGGLQINFKSRKSTPAKGVSHSFLDLIWGCIPSLLPLGSELIIFSRPWTTVWLSLPVPFRRGVYWGLSWLGVKLYGKTASFMQRLPFGLYLKRERLETLTWLVHANMAAIDAKHRRSQTFEAMEAILFLLPHITFGSTKRNIEAERARN